MADRYFGPEDQYQVGEARTPSDHYSSAREYAAAGEYDRGGRQQQRGNYGSSGNYDQGGYGRGGFDQASRGQGGSYGQRSDYGQRGDYGTSRHREESQGSRYGQGNRDRYQDRGYQAGNDRDRDRGFFDRAGDEVRSWFGDEEAERRRERDQRYDEQRQHFQGHPEDSHYHNWRRERISELDRDYDEYRREHAQRFHNEFSSWRTERQGQRSSLGQVTEHMEVVGSDGEHIGKVDKVRGDRIILAKNDPDAGGHHHSIPSRWIQSVDDKVTLRKSATEAKSAWKDEERSGAFFGGDRDEQGSVENRGDDSGAHMLNRSFSGTY